MSSDLCLIPDAAQTDTDVLFIQGCRHTAGNGSFPGTRRTHQADDRTPAFTGQYAHGQIFQNSFFYLRESVMIFIKNLLSPLQIAAVSGSLIPGQFQQCLYIGPFHRRLRITAKHSPVTINLPADLLLDFLLRFQLLHRRLKLLHVGIRILFP